MGVPFDRGRLFACLWPPPMCVVWLFDVLMLLSRCLVWNFPLEMLMVFGVLCLVMKLNDCLMNWKHHFVLASVISDWHRAGLKSRMKKKGLKPRSRPLPPPLVALPCKLMVLTAVMMSSWSVAMAGPVFLAPPVTWVEAGAGVRGLVHPWAPFLTKPRKPPDPSVPSRAGEGEEAEDPLSNDSAGGVNPLSEADVKEIENFRIERGPCVEQETGCHCEECKAVNPSPSLWDDLSKHVQCCFISPVMESFGPIGLMDVKDKMEAIVDTGASICVTPFADDFESLEMDSGKHVLKGLSKGCAIKGRGIVHWKLEVGGKTVVLKLRALLVPECEHRLLCPQQVVKEHQPKIPPATIEEECVKFVFKEGVVECPCNDSNLPVVKLCTEKEAALNLRAMHFCVTQEANQNLNVAQKELLKWHCRLGHVSFQRVQMLMRAGALGDHPKVRAAAKLDLDKDPFICGSCAFGKAKRKASRPKTIKGKDWKPAPVAEKVLSKETLFPGQKVSMDHFIVSTPGRLWTSRGSESHDRMFKGGVIFVDHASGYVFVSPVVNFTAGEALRAKREFEAEMASMGVTVLKFHTDNGVFTSAEFQDELARNNQGLTLSGVGAHHQNAVAERSIGTVTSLARTMMLHAKLRWPKAVSTKLWPMAMKQAEFMVNHVPDLNNSCPMDRVTGSFVPRTLLKNVHVWGCPSYVLDPKLQDGHKIPKFDPRSRKGLNLGWSPKHASTVPMILNLLTGSCSPQFHVVFDDWFSTVSTEDKLDDDSVESEEWTQLFVNDRIQVDFDSEGDVELADEWLSEAERMEKHQRAVARVQARQPVPVMTIGSDNVPSASESPVDPVLPTPKPVFVPEPEKAPMPVPPPAVPTDEAKQREPTESPRRKKAPQTPKQRELPQRTGRAKPPGFFKGMVAAAMMAVTNGPLVQLAVSSVGNPLAHACFAGFDVVTETFDVVDCVSFQAMMAKTKGKKGDDPDYPSLEQAMLRPDWHEWKAAMDEEIRVLTELGTWTVVPRSVAIAKGAKIGKATWALRQKRSPSGEPTHKKSRLCFRGDLLTKGVDCAFDNFAPVVQWSSVRLMLILSIVHGLETRQVDYVNAFAQADLDREMFMEVPKGVEHMNDFPVVLQLHKSLYGLTDAPLLFFEMLKKNLAGVGFKQLDHVDPCFFVHKNAICLTYVDDCLWFGRDGKQLDALIAEMQKKMELKVESTDVSDFLGIRFTRKGDTIELKQDHLIAKVMEATGMSDCESKGTPAEAKPLGKDKDGPDHSESWSYPSVVGMLLYLAGNNRPDIAFAVHQAARFTHAPKQSHAKAVKRIVRYLQGTKDKGLVFKPTNDWKVDCFVDADFCGLWGSEDPNDPVVTKSRTGFVIMLAGCPLLWVSKLQTETSVSTMMAEYVALSSAMRELLPLKRLVKKVAKFVSGDSHVKVTTLSDVWEDNNGALTVATMPKVTPQSKFFAVKLHFFREHVKTEHNPEGEVHIRKVRTSKQLADIFTKGLVEDKFNPLRDRLMGWDLDENGNAPDEWMELGSETSAEANFHLRGSVKKVRLVSSPTVPPTVNI